MSAAGRSVAAETGHERHDDDFYKTPPWCTRAILPHLKRTASVLDPCCGDGAILDVVKTMWPGAVRRGIEIDPARANVSGALCRDALRGPWPPWAIGTIVTNPPYALAMDFVKLAVARKKNEAAFLLRLSWLATQKRAPFHRAHPSDIYVLPKRPEFCASISCLKRKGGCGWHVTQDIDLPRPDRCPECGHALDISTSDACEYAWFVFGPGRGNRWQILDIEA